MSRFALLATVLFVVAKPQTEREWRDMFQIYEGRIGSWNDGSDWEGFGEDDDDEYEWVTEEGPTIYRSAARSWAQRRAQVGDD